MTFRLSQLTGDAVLLSTANATAMADGLLRMAHCLIIELPEPQLQDLRYTLDLLLMRVDQILDAEDLSLNFDGLTTNPDLHRHPQAEDFGAILVSTSVSTTSDTYGLTPASSPSYRHQKLPVPTRAPTPNPDGLATDPDINRNPQAEDFGAILVSTSVGTAGGSCGSTPTFSSSHNYKRLPVPPRAPTPVPTRAPTPTEVPKHGPFPYVISSRANVGIPDYTHHPLFIQPGVPGPYYRPPSQSDLTHGTYFVVSRGLYVGVFEDCGEVEPWVVGVPGSLYRRTKTWEEAKTMYNTRLAAGAVKVLP